MRYCPKLQNAVICTIICGINLLFPFIIFLQTPVSCAYIIEVKPEISVTLSHLSLNLFIINRV